MRVVLLTPGAPGSRENVPRESRKHADLLTPGADAVGDNLHDLKVSKHEPKRKLATPHVPTPHVLFEDIKIRKLRNNVKMSIH